MSDTFENSRVRHGTHSGWAKHKKLGQDPCSACYAAKQEYDRRRRSASREARRSRLHARAQGRAYQELRARYAIEYKELYEDFKTELYQEQCECASGYDPECLLHGTK